MSSASPKAKKIEPAPEGISKCPTGIRGLDEITFGGLPRGRPTLVCGGPGCGKTLLGMEFLVRGAIEFNEPGVCVTFEETADELAKNVASFGFELEELVKRKKLAIDYVFIERSLVEETGEYDLEALFVRLGNAVESVKAKRVVLDSVEALFAGLPNESILRAELRRLFRWLKERNLTTVITGERGNGSLTRHGLEEYISDCVILLDHGVANTVFTRRLRVVKYRGSTHGTNEYPFLIDAEGISVLPVTSIGLRHPASEERVSTGIAPLDAMLGGKGLYRGSSVLISGTAGTGKTSLAAHFVNAACERGERCLIFSFEESPEQIQRNVRSIGIDLGRWVDEGLLRFHSERPTTFGLEMHLVKMHKLVEAFDPSAVVVDPITALLHSGTAHETRSMLVRMVDFLKHKSITAILTALTSGGEATERTEVDVSSIVDTWLLLRDIEIGGERNRGLYILKARGLSHSNQIREFLLTDHGVELQDVYLAQGNNLLTGSARVAQETRDRNQELLARQQVERKRLIMQRKRKALEAQMESLRVEIETQDQELNQLGAQEGLRSAEATSRRSKMSESREKKAGGAQADGKARKPRGGRR